MASSSGKTPDQRVLDKPRNTGAVTNSLFGLPVFSPNGKLLAHVQSTAGIDLRSVEEGESFALLSSSNFTPTSIAISPDGKLLAAVGGTSIIVWSLVTRIALSSITGVPAATGIVFAPSNDAVITGHSDSSIRIWSWPDRKMLSALTGHTGAVRGLAVSPGGTFLVSGSADRSLRLWTLPDGRFQYSLIGHTGDVRVVALTPDGKTLASGDSRGVIILWDLVKRDFRSFLFDPDLNSASGVTYSTYDQVSGQVIYFTLPCGSPIPPGATCVCNCVAGTVAPPSTPPPPTGGGGGGGTICICNLICTCNLVFR
jgi:WD40 repeat protein